MRPPVLLNYLIDSQLLITGREGEMEVAREEYWAAGRRRREGEGEREGEREKAGGAGFCFLRETPYLYLLLWRQAVVCLPGEKKVNHI